MIEILILYILSKYDSTIYKVRKLIEEKFFMYASPSLGTINPALKRLETLSCVEFESKMTDGGMLSKTYKITPFGLKYLKDAILSFEFKNKSNVLNNVSILLCVSDVLEEDEEKKELNKTLLNHLLLLKKEIDDALLNPYNMYEPMQKAVIKKELLTVESLIEVLQ